LNQKETVVKTQTPVFGVAKAVCTLALLGAGFFGVSAASDRGPPTHERHFDGRYAHNQYYPNPGHVSPTIPRHSIEVERGGTRYRYGGGVWYSAYGPRWRVVGPPLGVYVPLLPDFYTTVWFGGLPYYYANDSYYVWRDGQRGYEVVQPPVDVQSSVAPPIQDLIMYPKNNQSEAQQGQDRYECHRWAADQTTFDPTRAAEDVPTAQWASKRAEYFRAMSACLEGRDYSVK